MKIIDKIRQIAYEERQKTLNKYNTTTGMCIETSDRITNRILLETKLQAHPKLIWVLYEYFENCYEYCYEEHWITYVLYKGRRIYIDATMDQFQWAFSKNLPDIYISYKLPNFYLIHKPGRTILDRCGWTDWYNKGNYINNFNYWD